MATNIEVAENAVVGNAGEQTYQNKKLKFRPFTKEDLEHLKNNRSKSATKLAKELGGRHDTERIEIKLAEIEREETK